MNDIVKQYREKHPWLDFIAGFIPGVGEAQDIQDLAYAVKDKDALTAGLSLLGFVLPGVTGGQINKGIKLAKRKFSKASKPPIYTSETAPKTLKLDKRDVTEMHLNDGEGSEQIFGKELVTSLNDRFNAADHGTAIRIGESLQNPNYGLSSSSAPLFYKMTRRWASQGKGGYFVPHGEPEMVQLNRVAQWIAPPGKEVQGKFDQKLVDQLNKEIKQINESGYKFPLATFVKRENKFTPGTAAYEAFERSPNNKVLLIPNIGFLKYKDGGKYAYGKTTGFTLKQSSKLLPRKLK